MRAPRRYRPMVAPSQESERQVLIAVILARIPSRRERLRPHIPGARINV